MQIAAKPEAAIYGRPMVYMNFMHRMSANLDDASASGSEEVQKVHEDGSTECVDFE